MWAYWDLGTAIEWVLAVPHGRHKAQILFLWVCQWEICNPATPFLHISCRSTRVDNCMISRSLFIHDWSSKPGQQIPKGTVVHRVQLVIPHLSAVYSLSRELRTTPAQPIRIVLLFCRCSFAVVDSRPQQGHWGPGIRMGIGQTGCRSGSFLDF